ncbi:MAG TPA: LPS biosynthesis protein, partial [Lachnoclostridium phytofermentans]|nr:LPS biosynthesis protein [Lachnoclostridium phytofermentans]
MHFDSSYFEDETREGFYIPGMVKRSWAVQMEVLNVIADICEKNGIRWFADCGTLLGAVRHGGFIPWDDDLDICMLREDYIRFNKVVRDSVPEGYRVLNLEFEDEYDNFITRVTNSSAIGIGVDYLKNNHGFPYVAGVDIFPLDYLMENDENEEERRVQAYTLWNLAEDIK